MYSGKELSKTHQVGGGVRMRCHRRVEWGKECCCWAASLPPWQVPGVGLRPGLQLSGGPPDLCGDIAGKVSSVFIIERGSCALLSRF